MSKTRIKTVDLKTGYKTSKGINIVTAGLNESLFCGELTCLLGPNGAGKSTLLRTLAGFQKPLAGYVEVDGRSLSEIGTREIARLISVVLTEKPMLENMSVESLIGLGRAPYTGFWGRLSATDHEAIDRAISLVGIESLRFRDVQSLSDGERQKVMIAKAFAQEAPVIFLDEPTAFLDYPSKVEIMMLLSSLARQLDKTIFMSTHDLDMALQIADRIWLIDQALGVATGTHRELSESGKLEKYFLRPGIMFDRKSGLFRLKLESSLNDANSASDLDLIQ